MTNARAKLLLHVSVVITLILSAMSQTASAQDLSAFDTGSDNQLGLTFTPDGSTAFWVAWNGDWGSSQASQQVIYASQQQDGVWSTPAPAEFSGHHSDSDPFVTPDGQWLYFVSDRPTNDDDESLDTNIWRYSLIERNVLEYISINSSSREYSPVVTTSGALYFASDREGGPGQGDLYRAASNGSGFLPPQPLGPAFNTPAGEWNLWVSADENEIIFEASSRPTNVSSSGDLYYSWRTPAGWTDATPLEEVNSQNSDLMPRLHPDGETLYFTSAPMGGHAQIATEEWTQMRARARNNLLLAERPDWAMDPDPEPDRIRVLIRGDDFGRSHASNLAMQEAFINGQMTSASVMPSGAWFQESAAMIRAHPEWSIGLHLAISSEWDQLHFGPLLPPSEVPTLVAEDGYFYHSYPEWPLGLWILEEPPYLFSGEGEMPAAILDRRKERTASEYPDPGEVEAELRAQIQRAKELGVRFEYFDVHMGGAYVPELRPVLFKLAEELGVPIPEDGWMGYEDIHLRFWSDGPAASKTLAEKLRSLRPGLYRIVLHPLVDTEEARAVDSFFGVNWAREGQAALDALTSEEVKNAIAEMNIELVTVGDLWDYANNVLSGE